METVLQGGRGSGGAMAGGMGNGMAGGMGSGGTPSAGSIPSAGSYVPNPSFLQSVLNPQRR
jgi:hypothetical protein